MKQRKFKLAAIVLIAVFAVMCLSLTACTEKEAVYYLSDASNFWTTYDKADDVPQNIKFVKQDADVYTLTIELVAGNSFTINKVGSNDKIGYDSIFSTANKLTQGSNNEIAVAEDGTYVLTLNVTDAVVTYSFTAKQPAEATITTVEITQSVSQLKVGEQSAFTALVTYSDNSKNGNVDWTSSNSDVATVDNDGIVTAIAEGVVDITASKGGKSDKITLTVVAGDGVNVSVTGVKLNKNELTLELDGTEKLVATIQPSNATNKNVLWESTNTNVATVDQQGNVTAVAAGVTTVRATTADGGHTDECVVTVRQPVTSISVPSTLTLVAGGSSKIIDVTVLPSGATNRAYKVEVVEGAALIEISDDANGAITVQGVASGTATIKVTSLDNVQLSAECKITIRESGEIFASLDRENVSVAIADAITLEATLDGAEIASVSWSIGSTAVASITNGDNNTATVTGVAFGTTKVTATITDTNGNTYTATCTVLVTSSFFQLTGIVGGITNWEVMDEATATSTNRILSQSQTGIYTLTRHFSAGDSFQIIFPDMDTNWNTALVKYTYYVEDASASGLTGQTSDGKNVVLTYAGNYTVKLDLTGTSAKWSVIVNSVDVTGITLALGNGSAILQKGATEQTEIKLTINPAAATYTAEDIKWWVEDQYGEMLQLTPSADKRTLTVTLLQFTSEEQLKVAIHCSVKDVEDSFSITLMPASAQKEEVTEVTFDDSVYEQLVSDGWSITVSAHVNSNATVQGVTYSSTDSNVTVNSTTGVVTSSILGTYTIRATAVDNGVYNEIQVTFYSNSVYMAGVLEGVDKWTTDNSATHGFVADDQHRIYTLTGVTLNKNDAFKIIYDGMDANWNGAITATYLDPSSYNVSKTSDGNFVIGERAIYKITLDCSGAVASVKVEKTGDPDASQAADYDVTVKIYGAGSNWNDNPYVTQEGTIKPNAGEYTITVTKTFATEFSGVTWPNIQFVTVKGTTETWYNENNTDVAFSGSMYSSSNASGKWCGDGSCKLWYQSSTGVVPTTTKFTFIFTFDDFGALTAIEIN